MPGLTFMYMASWSFVEQLVVRQNLRGPCLSSARRPKSINKDPPDVSLLVLSQKHIKSRCFHLQHLQFAIPVVLLTLPERHLKALTFVTVSPQFRCKSGTRPRFYTKWIRPQHVAMEDLPNVSGKHHLPRPWPSGPIWNKSQVTSVFTLLRSLAGVLGELRIAPNFWQGHTCTLIQFRLVSQAALVDWVPLIKRWLLISFL